MNTLGSCLDEEVVQEVVKYFQSFMGDKTVVLGEAGKRAFFQAALARDDFLPEGVQMQIDRIRSGDSQANYLFSHDSFSTAFSRYR